MKELKINGTTEFMGVEIPNIYGGFGEGKKAITDKHIAEIHDMKPFKIRERINDNIKRFKEGMDYVNIKRILDTDTLIELGYAKQAIKQADNIYLLSERGYAKLIKIMDTDLAWEIHDKLIDEYFQMKEIISSNEQLRNAILGKIYDGGVDAIQGAKELVKLETKPLIEEIEKLSPLAQKYNIFMDTEGLTDIETFAKNLSLKGLGRNNMYKYLRDKGFLKRDNRPYQQYIDNGYFKLKPSGCHMIKGEVIQDYKSFLTAKGVNSLINKLIKDGHINN